MITIESDRTASAIQTIAGEVLGWQPSVSQAGRLGNEISFPTLTPAVLSQLRKRLALNGHRVYVTRTK